MFSSLRERNYRLYAGGQVISNVGTWMQRVAQDWLVLELSGRSPAALGFAAGLQFLPTLVLSMWAGMLADRMDKRRLLLVLQAGMGGCALILGLLDVTGIVALWQVYLFCLVLGCFTAMDAPIRQSFVGEMVGPRNVTNAVALNSMTFNLARVVGPAVAGVMITWVGTGWVFLSNAVSFVAVIAGLFAMDPTKLRRHTANKVRMRGICMAISFLDSMMKPQYHKSAKAMRDRPARPSSGRSLSGKRNRGCTSHRADGRLVADEELYRAFEAQLALHGCSRSNHDPRNIADYLQELTRRFFHQDAAFHM